MVYESDFYTSRRAYRPSPSLSTYTVTSEPSRQIRILPGLGKVHVVHSYDRIIPYIGHKRLTVVTHTPSVVRVRPSTLYREYDRIENKLRPYSYNSYTNDYLNSNSHVRIIYVRNPITGSLPVYRPSTLYTSRYYNPYYVSRVYYPSYLDYTPAYLRSLHSPSRYYYYSHLNLYPSDRWLDLSLYPSWRHTHYARMFDDETRAIRAQINSLSNQVHSYVPRKLQPLPVPYTSVTSRFTELPARWSNDNYVHKMICSTPSNSAEYTTYWSDPVKRQFYNGRLACVSIIGGKGHPRRRNIYVFEDDPVRSDIQLLSYYINRFREERNIKKPISVRVILPPLRPSRVFSVPRPLEDAHMDTEEVMQMKQERNARLAKLNEIKPEDLPKVDVKAKLAEEKAKREATLPTGARKAAEKKQEEEEAAAKQVADAEEDKKNAVAIEAKQAEEAKKAAEEAAAKKAAKEAAAAAAAAEALKAAEAAKKEKEAKEEADRKEKEAKEAAAKAAELERLAELAKEEEIAKQIDLDMLTLQAEIERAKKEEEERVRLEEEKRQAEAAKAEEERQQLLRLEEIARQAEEEKEAELVRQAEELAELARQEAELTEQAKAEEEVAEQLRKEAEAAELAQKEAELAELECKEKELTEQAEQARAEADEAAAEIASEEHEVPVEEPASEEPIIEEPASPALDEEFAEALVEDTAPEEEPTSPFEE